MAIKKKKDADKSSLSAKSHKMPKMTMRDVKKASTHVLKHAHQKFDKKMKDFKSKDAFHSAAADFHYKQSQRHMSLGQTAEHPKDMIEHGMHALHHRVMTNYHYDHNKQNG